MIKICYCTTIYRTITNFILKSAEYLHEHTDWDISFICDYDEGFAKSLPGYFHYYPVKMKRGISPDGIGAIMEMTRIFRREKFDMVQFSTPNAALYASIAAKRAGIKIRNYHLMGLRYMGSSGFGRLILKQLEKASCKNATSIECVSRSNMRMGIEEGLFPRDKVTVVWNGSTGGVNLERFDCSKREQWRREVRHELGIRDGEFVYGFVGRITRDKGINELFKAFFNLNNGTKLLLIGRFDNQDNPDAELLNCAKADSDVIFREYVNDVERYYAAIDVLVLPSYREGFGNVVIEAAAVGTPAIVSDIPGPTDAVEPGKTAFVTPPGDAAGLEEMMKKIYRADYKTMGRDSVEFARHNFDSEVLCEKILERKRDLLTENNAR